MIRIIAARAIALAGVLILLFMDHRLFMPFGLFTAFGLFMVSAYIYRDFIDPKPLNEKQSYWAIVFSMIIGSFATEIFRTTNINFTIGQRILIFTLIVLLAMVYTSIDAKKKITKKEQRKLANKTL